VCVAERLVIHGTPERALQWWPTNERRERVALRFANARPAIATPLPSIDHYDTILLAGPIWNVRAPMIVSTVAEVASRERCKRLGAQAPG
jgi:hypothetical protein